MERYLYFSNPDSGAPNQTQETAMYATSSFLGAAAASATTTTLHFAKRSGATNPADTVTLTHTSGGHKVIFEGIASMVNAAKNNMPFQVVADVENSIFNISGVTACVIASTD
tara:strand:+ start:1175 stop:1510 length:336 start_codon:yes stop_codon:yes gene_type:complete